MSKIACTICREIIAEVDYTKLSLPLTPDQFKTPCPEREIPDPFMSNYEVSSWKCPFCRSYPIYGYDAGPDSIPYVLSEWKDNKFIQVKVNDVIDQQGKNKRDLNAIDEFSNGLVSALKKQPRIYQKEKKIYKCGTCGVIFNHSSSLSRHKNKKGHK